MGVKGPIHQAKLSGLKSRQIPIRGIEPRAAAIAGSGLKGGNVSRYTISDYHVAAEDYVSTYLVQ